MPFDPEIAENIIDKRTDDFLYDLQNENTSSFNSPPPPLMDSDIPDPETKQQEYTQTEDATGAKENPEQEKLADTVSELIITMFDITHNSLMRFVADEPDGSKFAVSQADKRKLKGSLSKVLESKSMTVSPEMLLFITAIIVYAPATIAAFQIRSMKAKVTREQQRAAAEREARMQGTKVTPTGPATATGNAPANVTVEQAQVYRNKGGRPAGTTKQVMEMRQQLERAAKRKK